MLIEGYFNVTFDGAPSNYWTQVIPAKSIEHEYVRI